MRVFVRSIVTGFGFSLGAALFRKVSSRLGLGDDKEGKTNGRADEVLPTTGTAGGSGPDGRKGLEGN